MLSSKLRADYIEMINHVLDGIHVDSPEDIQTAQTDLQNLLTPVEGFVYSQKYCETLDFIADYIENPENYVEHREDDEAFCQIIRDRIAAKINEFNALNEAQKLQYIQAQQKQRASAADTQRALASKVPPTPGSAGHVFVNEDHDLEGVLIALLQNVPLNAFILLSNMHASIYRTPTISRDAETAIAEGIITREQYLQISQFDLYFMDYLFASFGRAAVSEGIITLEQFLRIPHNERSSMQYLFAPNGRAAFAAGIITLEQYLQIPHHERYALQYLFAPNGRAAFAQGHITLEQYLQIPRHQREDALNNTIHSAPSTFRP